MDQQLTMVEQWSKEAEQCISRGVRSASPSTASPSAYPGRRSTTNDSTMMRAVLHEYVAVTHLLGSALMDE